MNPDDLIDQARHLAQLSAKKPKQADLRRAVSAAHYAAFHALCSDCADMMIGVGSKRKLAAWSRVYRSVNHGDAKRHCSQLGPLLKIAGPAGLDRGVRRFAASFPNLQEQRHRADYDPHARFKRSQVLGLIETADRASQGLRGAGKSARRDFACHILLGPAKG